MSVGLVIVSHSAQLSDGVAEVASQMAPGVRVLAAGGLQGGGVGTDFEKVSAAVAEADTGSGAVLLYDLGSAQMTAELVVETLGDPNTARVVDAPLVEGAVAAAVAAQGGKDVDGVARAAELAVAEQGAPIEAGRAEEVQQDIVLQNEVGLHARPAALLARSIAGLRVGVTVSTGGKDADASSVLAVMGLGARKGDRVTIRASGADAPEAVERIVALAERNFDE